MHALYKSKFYLLTYLLTRSSKPVVLAISCRVNHVVSYGEPRFYVFCVPVVESSRVYLQPIRGIEGSDYINASFIDVS